MLDIKSRFALKDEVEADNWVINYGESLWVKLRHITMFLHKGAGQQVHEAKHWRASMKSAAPHPFTG